MLLYTQYEHLSAQPRLVCTEYGLPCAAYCFKSIQRQASLRGDDAKACTDARPAGCSPRAKRPVSKIGKAFELPLPGSSKPLTRDSGVPASSARKKSGNASSP